MGVSVRELRKVIEEAGFKVVSIEERRHRILHVSNGVTTVRLVSAISPRTDNWRDWILQDIRREFRKKGVSA